MRFSTAKLMTLMGLGTLLLLFPADGLRALGLGEARVNSYLGQPLDITIRLIEADADALDSLTADQASASDYERLGVPPAALALGLNVQVDRRSDPPLVRVTSRRPANDPILRFMIDARWSSGRVLREYTVFLDPPTYEVAPPVTRRETEERPAERPPVAEPEPAPRPRPAPERPARPAEPAPTPEPRPSPGPGVVGPVAAGQTLWGIAYDWRPDTSLTMNQVMLAILERNPQAFRDDNVNRLLRGAELTMPDIEEIRSMPVGEADRRMQAQMQAWRDQTTQRREVPVIAEEAVPEVERPRQEPAEATPGPEVVHRLEVVPPESDLFDEGPAVSDGEIRRASRRLSELEDRMYAEGLESDELYRHVESIREAIETRDAGGLAVADEELAVLESRLRQARLARLEMGQQVVDPDADEDAVSDYFRELEDEFAVDDSDPAVATDSPAVTAADDADEIVPEPEPAVAPVADTPEQTGFAWWIWVVIALIVIGLAAAVLFVLKRRAATDMQRTPVTGRRGADAVQAARRKVVSDPRNLAAHLALLSALADRDDNQRFGEALDDMYRRVENDEDENWQEALNLAVVHAPDHPLLTPTETRADDDDDGDDDGLDDRTREMLGILESDEKSRPAPDDYELGSEVEPDTDLGSDEFFATDDDEQDAVLEGSDTRLMSGEEDESTGEDEDIGEDMDLAELSNRLDDPALLTREDERTVDSGEDEIDIGEFDAEEDKASEQEDIFGEASAEEDSDDDSQDDFDDDSDSDSDEQQDRKTDLDFNFTGEPAAVDDEGDDLDIDDLGLDVDDDLALPEEDDAAPVLDQPEEDDVVPELDQPEDEKPDAGDDGNREIEAFLAGDNEGEPESPESRDDDSDQDDPDQVESELSDEDAEVKLDLARAYLSMDDPESARALLEEITSGGSAAMREQAAKLLDDL